MHYLGFRKGKGKQNSSADHRIMALSCPCFQVRCSILCKNLQGEKLRDDQQLPDV